MSGATLTVATAIPTVAGAGVGDSTASDQILSPTGTPSSASGAFQVSGALLAGVAALYAVVF